MATYRTHIPEGVTLEKNDLVYFIIDGHKYPHSVSTTFLSNKIGENSLIFDVLKLNKNIFCEEHYGYVSHPDGEWPAYNYGDMEAATRVVNALFDIIDGPRNTHIFLLKDSIPLTL